MSRAQLTSTVEQNTGGAVAPFLAGKNKIINGDFGIWQRGTSSGAITTGGSYQADRWKFGWNGNGTNTISQQSFTPGSNVIPGYEPQYFHRFTVNTVGTNTTFDIYQCIENVQTFAGQTVTFSFWAKADSSRSIQIFPYQVFGSGGSAASPVTPQTITLTTSWARYSYTVAIPSISGQTVGTGSSLNFGWHGTPVSGMVIDFWGVQLEAGSVATPFTTASGTLQGELALCQRYYEQSYDIGTAIGTATSNGQVTFRGFGYTGTTFNGTTTNSAVWNEFSVPFQVKKRAVPSINLYSPVTGASGKFRNYDASTDLTYNIDTIGQQNFTFGSGQVIAPNYYCGFQWTASAEL